MSESKSWAERLFGGFRKTADRLSENLAPAFTSEEPAATPEPAPERTPAPALESSRAPAPSIVAKVASITRTAKLDDATLDEVEDALILTDLGPKAAAGTR